MYIEVADRGQIYSVERTPGKKETVTYELTVFWFTGFEIDSAWLDHAEKLFKVPLIKLDFFPRPGPIIIRFLLPLA